MNTWQAAYKAYRQFVSQSLACDSGVLVISPDNDDPPADECTRPVLIGSYETEN